ncbi:MAG: AI-2E family transporter [Sandaracinaceae bacterium]|nr:AI-2E family transporter [Sandaracinaceae bacterium]
MAKSLAARARELRMSSEVPPPRFFLLLMVTFTVLLGMVLRPMASELVLAAVLATALWPLQAWLVRRLHTKRHGLVAGLILLVLVLLLIGPLWGLAALVIRDGSDGLRFVLQTLHGEGVARMVASLPESARDLVQLGLEQLPATTDELMATLGTSGNQTARVVGAAVVGTGSFLFHTGLMLVALYFFLTHGEELVHWLDSISPLGRGQTRELLVSFKQVSVAVIVSSLATSTVQALAALIGFLIARVPSPIFFVSLAFVAAFIPAIGAATVSMVAALFLLVTGHPYMALFLAIWSVFVVGLVDNLIKPILIKRGVEIHAGVVFFALLGGLAAFGPIGLLLGPLVVAMFLALLRMYQRDYSPGGTDEQDPVARLMPEHEPEPKPEPEPEPEIGKSIISPRGEETSA